MISFTATGSASLSLAPCAIRCNKSRCETRPIKWPSSSSTDWASISRSIRNDLALICAPQRSVTCSAVAAPASLIECWQHWRGRSRGVSARGGRHFGGLTKRGNHHNFTRRSRVERADLGFIVVGFGAGVSAIKGVIFCAQKVASDKCGLWHLRQRRCRFRSNPDPEYFGDAPGC